MAQATKNWTYSDPRIAEPILSARFNEPQPEPPAPVEPPPTDEVPDTPDEEPATPELGDET